MESRSFTFIICIALCGLLSSTLSEANQYFVGGSKEIGWNDKPRKESYNHWAKRTKFVLNDTIVFIYPLGKDSVLYVREEDYKTCNNKNPVKRWYDGYSEVDLHFTGGYHFIGGNDGSSEKGQRLRFIVPEVQPPPAASAPSPSVAPTTAPPSSPSSATPYPTPSTSPPAHSPATAPSPWSPPVMPPSLPPPSSSPSQTFTPPAPPTPGPAASPPQPSHIAPAPAPSSAWSITARSLFVPAVSLLFGGFISFSYY